MKDNLINNVWWTKYYSDNVYNEIKDRKYPICIPSYNRPDNLIVKKLSEDFDDYLNYPIYLFVRESQRDAYEEFHKDNKWVTIIPCEDVLVSDVGLTRRYIQKWLYNNNIDTVFFFDDDIYDIDVTYRAYTAKGAPKSKVIGFSMVYALAWWQLAMEQSIKKFGTVISGGMPMGFSWKDDYCDINLSGRHNVGTINQVVCINNKDLVDNNIIYKSNDECGHEDLDLLFQIAEKKLDVALFPFIAYSASPMTFENFSNFGNDMHTRMSSQQKIMRDVWEDKKYSWIKFRDKRGVPQVVMYWQNYRRDNNIKEYKFNIFEDIDFIENM